MDALWGPVSEEARAVIRRIAEGLLPVSDEFTEALWQASQQGARQREYVEDPVLAEADRRFVRASMTHWLVSNLDDPGGRVPPLRGNEMLIYARDLVLRGLDTDEPDAWRAGQRVATKIWLEACFAAEPPLPVLHEVIEVSTSCLTTYIDDCMVSVGAYSEEVRTELGLGAQAERQTTVQLLLQGASIARGRAEELLGYALTGHHVGGVVWAPSADAIRDLERAAEATMRACGAARRLTIAASTAALWIWIPVDRLPAVRVLGEAIARTPAVRVALGRPGADITGFRETHADAVAAQKLMVRVASPRSVVRYEDVHLVDLMSADVARAEQFTESILGELATADPEIQRTVQIFIDEGFSVSPTAERLYAHRNTIDRRLTRARAMLPRPLEGDPTSVSAALRFLELRR